MRSACWLVLGVALVCDVITGASLETDPEGDGQIGENTSREQIALREGLIEDAREQGDPECVLLASTDLQPTKYLLDRTVNEKCNAFDRGDMGDCNCPKRLTCDYEGVIVDSRVYFCRSKLPSDDDQYGNGLILGELEYPQVFIIEGSDKK